MNLSLLLKISITIVLFTTNRNVLSILSKIEKISGDISNGTIQDIEENQNVLEESDRFKNFVQNILNETPKDISENYNTLREFNETREIPQETKNENPTDIHKDCPNSACSSDIILDHSIELISDVYTSKGNSEYNWRIIVPEDDHQILLQFHYVFGVNNSKKNCEKNYIEIRNGLSPHAELIQRICEDFPYNIYSKGRELFIKLVNHEVNGSLKFSTYITNVLDICHYAVHVCEHHCVNTFQGYTCLCDEGFHLDSEGKKCISNYNEYGTINHEMCENNDIHEDYECQWTIMAPHNHRIVLNFTHLSLGQEYSDSSNCSGNNHIKIIELFEDHTIEISLYCGTELPPIRLSRSNRIGIELRTNENILNSEFTANYHIVKDECAFNNGGCPDQCRKTIDSFDCFSCIDHETVNHYK